MHCHNDITSFSYNCGFQLIKGHNLSQKDDKKNMTERAVVSDSYNTRGITLTRNVAVVYYMQKYTFRYHWFLS